MSKEGIQKVLDKVNKKFGQESIASNKIKVKRVSSGCLSLDLALGGGMPEGRLVELLGVESSGKTSIALHLAAEVQKLGKRVGYIDSEHSLDLFYAENLGVNVNIDSKDPMFVLSQPTTGEESLGIIREFADSGEFGLIVLDSVASLVPKALLQGEIGDAKMAVIARLMSQWIPALVAPANRTGCIILFLNQYRTNIGVMYGNPLIGTGGNALKYYASIRLDVARVGQNKDGEEVLSNKTRVKVIKNKVSVPFKQAFFDIEFGTGINTIGDVLDLAAELDVVKKAGSWYSYEETKLGQGRQSVIDLLKDNPEIVEEIELKVRKELNL